MAQNDSNTAQAARNIYEVLANLSPDELTETLQSMKTRTGRGSNKWWGSQEMLIHRDASESEHGRAQFAATAQANPPQ